MKNFFCLFFLKNPLYIKYNIKYDFNIIEKFLIGFKDKIYSVSISNIKEKIYSFFGNKKENKILKFDINKEKMEISYIWIRLNFKISRFNKDVELNNEEIIISDEKENFEYKNNKYSVIKSIKLNIQLNGLLLVNFEYWISTLNDKE